MPRVANSRQSTPPPAEPTTAKITRRQPKAEGLSVPMYLLDGKEAGRLDLPKELFGGKINQSLLAQAARVYLSNQSGHFSNTKTRSEVKGSSRKIYRQKGTGGARHGSIRAPIFVGGGIAHGPKSRRVRLELPQKMRRAALLSALSAKLSEGEVIGVELSKASGKTSQLAKLVKVLNKKSVLFVLNSPTELIKRAVANLPSITVQNTRNLNVLEVLKYRTLALDRSFMAGVKEDQDAGTN